MASALCPKCSQPLPKGAEGICPTCAKASESVTSRPRKPRPSIPVAIEIRESKRPRGSGRKKEGDGGIVFFAIASILLVIAPFVTYAIIMACTKPSVRLVMVPIILLEVIIGLITAGMACSLGSRYLREMDAGSRDNRRYRAIKFGYETGWITLVFLALGLLVFCVWFGLVFTAVKHPYGGGP
jgi:hypothetical protein